MFQIDFQIEEIPCGGHYYAEHEMEWPEGSFEKCEKADAILLGAVGHEVDGKTVFTKPGKPYPEPQLAGLRAGNTQSAKAESLRQCPAGQTLSRRQT
jgi:isocitrate/isopropylmalate dehydrogenase